MRISKKYTVKLYSIDEINKGIPLLYLYAKARKSLGQPNWYDYYSYMWIFLNYTNMYPKSLCNSKSYTLASYLDLSIWAAEFLIAGITWRGDGGRHYYIFTAEEIDLAIDDILEKIDSLTPTKFAYHFLNTILETRKYLLKKYGDKVR